MRLLLIRHGETAWNPDNRFQGSADTELSEKGREQARRLGERLRGKRIDRIISSPLSRARETAEAIAGHHGLTVEIEPRLCEVNYGYWEGKNASELLAEGDPGIGDYLRDRDYYGFPGEGTLNNARYRIGSYLDELKRGYWETDEVIVLVGHAAIFRMGIFHLLDIGNIYYYRIVPSNTGITTFSLSKEKGIRLECYNDTSHLDQL